MLDRLNLPIWHRRTGDEGSARDRFLPIYLNDHLAGAMLGVELVRRVRSANRDNVELDEPLQEICAEIEADRATLERLMDRLEIRRGVVKPAGAWVAEKLGRLKLNGRLHGYSPLSLLVELELLHVGVTGKKQMWEVLERTLGREMAGFDLQQLAARAALQRTEIERLHRSAAAKAFAEEPATAADDRDG